MYFRYLPLASRILALSSMAKIQDKVPTFNLTQKCYHIILHAILLVIRSDGKNNLSWEWE
jgi:hypothetical protein